VLQLGQHHLSKINDCAHPHSSERHRDVRILARELISELGLYSISTEPLRTPQVKTSSAPGLCCAKIDSDPGSPVNGQTSKTSCESQDQINAHSLRVTVATLAGLCFGSMYIISRAPYQPDMVGNGRAAERVVSTDPGRDINWPDLDRAGPRPTTGSGLVVRLPCTDYSTTGCCRVLALPLGGGVASGDSRRHLSTCITHSIPSRRV
jgi:hypothetical protein